MKKLSLIILTLLSINALAAGGSPDQNCYKDGKPVKLYDTAVFIPSHAKALAELEKKLHGSVPNGWYERFTCAPVYGDPEKRDIIAVGWISGFIEFGEHQ